MAKRPPPKRHYHHGDLHGALIRAGLAIVEKEGVQALTLRAVARRARVSHSAPYHHFASHAELLAAVAAAGFDQLVEKIGSLQATATRGTPIDRLRMVGRGYVLFAAERPNVFRLMFRPELTTPSKHPVLLGAEAKAFATLVEAIAACQKCGELPGHHVMHTAAACWSMVHGLALLHVDQVLKETPLGQFPLPELSIFVNEISIAGLKGLPVAAPPGKGSGTRS